MLSFLHCEEQITLKCENYISDHIKSNNKLLPKQDTTIL